jgi:hypothetical protein
MGWGNKAWADAPGLFRFLSAPRRAEIVAATLSPAGSWWLKERFAEAVGIGAVRCATEVTAAKHDGGRVVLDLAGPGGSDRIEADHVIAATGYDVDVSRLTVLAEPLRARVRPVGAGSRGPVLDSSFQTSVPGLFAVGLASAPTFGPAMRFVLGCAYTARRVAAALPH